MLRSISFRLAALYTGLFTIAVVMLGAGMVLSTRATMVHQLDTRITAETDSLVVEYRIDKDQGLQDVIAAVRERGRMPGALEYGLNEPAGRRVGGGLAGMGTKPGWSMTSVQGA